MRMINRTALSCVFLLLAGCLPPAPPEPDLSPPDFSKQEPIALDVADVTVVDAASPSGRGHHVEEYFPTAPAAAIDIWAKQRLRPAGRDGRLEVVIGEASAVEKKLPLKRGLTGKFTKEPSERYTVRQNITLKLYKPNRNLPVAEASAGAEVIREMVEGSSDEERDALAAEMIREVTARLDREIEGNMQRYFGPYLVY